MIVFLTISKRRFYVLDAPSKPMNYHNGEGMAHEGYRFAAADMIAGPCSWTEALSAATTFAKEKGITVTYDEYCKHRDAFDAEIREVERERKSGTITGRIPSSAESKSNTPKTSFREMLAEIGELCLQGLRYDGDGAPTFDRAVAELVVSRAGEIVAAGYKRSTTLRQAPAPHGFISLRAAASTLCEHCMEGEIPEQYMGSYAHPEKLFGEIKYTFCHAEEIWRAKENERPSKEKTYIIAQGEYMGIEPTMYEFKGTYRALLEHLNQIENEPDDAPLQISETESLPKSQVPDSALEHLFNLGNGDGQSDYQVWCVEDGKMVISPTTPSKGDQS